MPCPLTAANTATPNVGTSISPMLASPVDAHDHHSHAAGICPIRGSNHSFCPPQPHDKRSPCPALNTLANHGFLYVRTQTRGISLIAHHQNMIGQEMGRKLDHTRFSRHYKKAITCRRSSPSSSPLVDGSSSASSAKCPSGTFPVTTASNTMLLFSTWTRTGRKNTHRSRLISP